MLSGLFGKKSGKKEKAETEASSGGLFSFGGAMAYKKQSETKAKKTAAE